jgi:hypothetical protein
VLELELAYMVADNSLTLRWGTNALKRTLSAAYAPVTHLGYAAWQAQTRFGFFEVRPLTRLLLRDLDKAPVPGSAFQMNVQIERQVPGSLTLERTAALPAAFAPLTTPPQLYLGGKRFQFQDSDGAPDAGFYRLRGSP